MSISNEPAKKCFDTAVRLLARREHSKLELGRKLKTKGYSTQQIEPVLDQLEAQNLQSDLRFTNSVIRVRQARGYGPVYISQFLREKGVTTEIIESALDFNDAAWQIVLEDAAVKKFGQTEPKDFKEKARQMNFLLRRGFSSELIQRFFNRQY